MEYGFKCYIFGLFWYFLGVLTVPGRRESLQQVTFTELCPGLNEGKVVLGKVICSVHSEDTVPL